MAGSAAASAIEVQTPRVHLVGGASTPYFYVKHFMHAHFVRSHMDRR